MIVIGLVGRAITGISAYMRIAYLGFLFYGISWIWSLVLLRGVRVKRKARRNRASVGDIFEEEFEISGISWPGYLWLEVDNNSTLPMASGSRLITGIGWRQKRFYTSRTLLTTRGSFILGPTTLASGDPLGLFTVSRSFIADTTLVVLPMIFPIKKFPLPPGLLPGGKSIRKKTTNITPHAAGVREYSQGDPMKRIHWPSTAKRGRFMVKEFEQDPEAEVWLFIDAEEGGQVRIKEILPSLGSGVFFRKPKIRLPRDTFEYSISIAASLGKFLLDEKRAVGLVCAERHFTVLPAERGDRQAGKLLETLAFLQPQGKLPISRLVSLQAKHIPMGSSVLLITTDTNQQVVLAMENLRRLNLRPAVVLVNPESFGGKGEPKKITSILKRMNIPLCQVNFEDDLSTKLSLPITQFLQPDYLRLH